MLFAIAIGILFATCKKEKDDKKNMQNVTLQGVVKDVSGNPLSGVKVVTGTASTTTSSDGKFSFTQVNVVKKRAIIKFEKSGYFTLTRSNVKESDMYMVAVMYPKGNSDISVQTSFKASEGMTLTVPKGMKVKFPASSIMKSDGSAYSGTVKVDMMYLSPKAENFTEMMPGGDLLALNSNNKEVLLIPWGMVNVNLTDGSGTPLQIKTGSKAELTFPIPEGMGSNPPTIPLWHFDEEKGIWIQAADAILKGDVYVGEVTHFSWVNLDYPAGIVNIKGKVVCEDGYPTASVKVTASNNYVYYCAYTNLSGEYSIIIPAQTPVLLSVMANGGSDSQSVNGQSGGTVYQAQSLVLPCNDTPPELGSGVYVVGSEINGQGIRVATLWKDNQKQSLSDGSINTEATSVYVSKNGDIHVVGYERPNTSVFPIAAKYWKNGIVQNLPNGTYANSVYVSGNDVYVAGGNGYSAAVLWKNGIAQNLPNGDYASSVYVSGNDVYVAGTYSWDAAVLWKNGIAQNLPNGDYASSVYVSGNDVYVAGCSPKPITGNIIYIGNSGCWAQIEIGNNLGLWKNGIAQELPKVNYMLQYMEMNILSYCSSFGYSFYISNKANSVFTSGSDVYFAFSGCIDGEASLACLYKNGEVFQLSNITSSANCVFVK